MRRALSIAIASLLAGCATNVTDARYELFQDGSSAVQIITHVRDDAREEFLKEMAACATTNRVLPHSIDTWKVVQTTAAFRTTKEAETAIACGPFSKNEPTLSVVISDGILRTEHSVEFSFLLRPKDTPWNENPSAIEIKMPGLVTEASDASIQLPVKVEAIVARDDVARISFSSQKSLEEEFITARFAVLEQIRLQCNNERFACKVIDDYRSENLLNPRVYIRVKSVKSKIDVQIALAFIGLLFGSGLMVEIARRLWRQWRTYRVSKGDA